MTDNTELSKIIIDDTAYTTKVTTKFTRRKPFVPRDPKQVCAVIPGVIRDVFVNKGQRVKRNQNLLVLEAMKMNNSITAPFDGIIKAVNVQTGKQVAKGEVILEFE
ncbi:MAG: biotin/lipoyl-containing protein [Ignavibacteriales bacterium]